MPVEQTLAGQGLLVALGGVQHHLDHALDVAVGRRQSSDVYAQATGDGGADLVLVQDFAFDLAGLEHVLGQCLQHGLGPQVEPHALHAAEQAALAVANGRKLIGESSHLPVESGPSLKIVDVFDHSPHSLR